MEQCSCRFTRFLFRSFIKVDENRDGILVEARTGPVATQPLLEQFDVVTRYGQYVFHSIVVGPLGANP